MDAKLVKAFKSFVSSGYKRHLFTKTLYKHLSLNVGFIAHYNQHGFFETYFSIDGADGLKSFKDQFNMYSRMWGFGDGKHRATNEEMLRILNEMG